MIDSVPGGSWCADMARKQREDLHFGQKFGIIGQLNCRIQAKMVSNRKFQMTGSRTSLLPLALLVLSVASVAASNQDLVFETDFTRFVLSTNATAKSLLEKKSSNDWLSPEPHAFSSVKKGGNYFSATGLTRDGELWRAEFGAAEVQAEFRITAGVHYVVFELVRVQGEGVEEVRFIELQVTCKQNAGWWLGAWWNERFAVALLGLSDCVNVQLLGNGVLAASVYPEFGMEGQRAVLVAVPTARFLDMVQQVERDFGLPSPRLAGQWAKTSRDVRTSYLFTDLTEANAEQQTNAANQGIGSRLLSLVARLSLNCCQSSARIDSVKAFPNSMG